MDAIGWTGVRQAACGSNPVVDEGCQKTCGHCSDATTAGVTTATTTTTTTRAGRECAQVSTPPVNIAFVVDSSQSLSDDNWLNTLAFVKNVIAGKKATASPYTVHLAPYAIRHTPYAVQHTHARTQRLYMLCSDATWCIVANIVQSSSQYNNGT